METKKLIEWINGVNSWLIEVGENYPGYVLGELIDYSQDFPLTDLKGRTVLKIEGDHCVYYINLLDEENIKELKKFPLGSGKSCNPFYLKSLTGCYFSVYCNIEIVNKV